MHHLLTLWSRPKRWQNMQKLYQNSKNIALKHCLLAIFLIYPLSSAATTPQAVQQLDALVQQWLALEQQQLQIQQDGQQRKQSLQQGISLLQAEQKQLQQVLERNNKQNNAVDEKRTELLAQQQQLEQQQQQGTKKIAALLQQVQVMQPQLPPPLQQLWQQELDSLSDSADSSIKLQRALFLLGKLAEFQQRLSLDDMTLTTAEGQQVRVRQLYLGASQAWFSSADGSYTGIGFPASTGWTWQFDNSIDSAPILSAIAILEKRAQAELISLPIQLSGETSAPTSAAEQEKTP